MEEDGVIVSPICRDHEVIVHQTHYKTIVLQTKEFHLLLNVFVYVYFYIYVYVNVNVNVNVNVYVNIYVYVYVEVTISRAQRLLRRTKFATQILC